MRRKDDIWKNRIVWGGLLTLLFSNMYLVHSLSDIMRDLEFVVELFRLAATTAVQGSSM